MAVDASDDAAAVAIGARQHEVHREDLGLIGFTWTVTALQGCCFLLLFPTVVSTAPSCIAVMTTTIVQNIRCSVRTSGDDGGWACGRCGYEASCRSPRWLYQPEPNRSGSQKLGPFHDNGDDDDRQFADGRHSDANNNGVVEVVVSNQNTERQWQHRRSTLRWKHLQR